MKGDRPVLERLARLNVGRREGIPARGYVRQIIDVARTEALKPPAPKSRKAAPEQGEMF